MREARATLNDFSPLFDSFGYSPHPPPTTFFDRGETCRKNRKKEKRGSRRFRPATGCRVTRTLFASFRFFRLLPASPPPPSSIMVRLAEKIERRKRGIHTDAAQRRDAASPGLFSILSATPPHPPSPPSSRRACGLLSSQPAQASEPTAGAVRRCRALPMRRTRACLAGRCGPSRRRSAG